MYHSFSKKTRHRVVQDGWEHPDDGADDDLDVHEEDAGSDMVREKSSEGMCDIDLHQGDAETVVVNETERRNVMNPFGVSLLIRTGSGGSIVGVSNGDVHVWIPDVRVATVLDLKGLVLHELNRSEDDTYLRLIRRGRLLAPDHAKLLEFWGIRLSHPVVNTSLEEGTVHFQADGKIDTVDTSFLSVSSADAIDPSSVDFMTMIPMNDVVHAVLTKPTGRITPQIVLAAGTQLFSNDNTSFRPPRALSSSSPSSSFVEQLLFRASQYGGNGNEVNNVTRANSNYNPIHGAQFLRPRRRELRRDQSQSDRNDSALLPSIHATSQFDHFRGAGINAQGYAVRSTYDEDDDDDDDDDDETEDDEVDFSQGLSGTQLLRPRQSSSGEIDSARGWSGDDSDDGILDDNNLDVEQGSTSQEQELVPVTSSRSNIDSRQRVPFVSREHRQHHRRRRRPVRNMRHGFDRLRDYGFRHAEVTALRAYFSRHVERWIHTHPNQASAAAGNEPDLLTRRLLQEEAWMNVQGPYSEFRLNVGHAFSSGGMISSPPLLQQQAQASSSSSSIQVPFGNAMSGGNNNVANDPFLWRTQLETTSNNAATEMGINTTTTAPGMGTDRDFALGFWLGFFVGFLMLVWVWMPTVSHKQKLGILTGITVQLALTMLQNGPSASNGTLSGAGGDTFLYGSGMDPSGFGDAEEVGKYSIAGNQS
jgi:hypothetical protein